MANWYILYNGQQIGPMQQEQLLAYGLTPDTLVWSEGMPQWVAAYTIPELMTMISRHAAGYQQGFTGQPGSPANSYPQSGKDKTVAGILAILLGGFGAQYFYCGKIGGGFLCILLSLLTCGIWPVLTFVQGILMLTMTQEQFDSKYVYSNSTLPLF